MGKFPGGTAQKWAARQCNTSHIVKWNLHTSRIESIVNIVGATWIYLIYYLIIWYIDTCLPVMLRLAFCTLASLSWKISTNIAIHVQSESQDHAAGGHTKALKSTCQAGKSHATMPNEFGKKNKNRAWETKHGAICDRKNQTRDQNHVTTLCDHLGLSEKKVFRKVIWAENDVQKIGTCGPISNPIEAETMESSRLEPFRRSSPYLVMVKSE